MTSEIKPEDVKLPEPYLKPEFGRQALFTADQVRAAVLEAKAQERRRCEQIALDERVDASDTGDATDAAYNVACEQIAAAIRSGK